MRKGFLIPLFSFAFAAGVAYADDVPTTKQEPPTINKDKIDVPAIKGKAEGQPEPGPSPKTAEPGPAPKVIVDGAVVPGFQCDGCWVDACEQANNCCGRCWASVEYLVWWIKDAPVPALVTTGDPKEGALAGALGSPGTRILFGGSDLSFDAFSGVRINLGGWLNCDRTIGVEVSGF
ncbi:MAG TPA: BBP7 family outer membrane beta-barrel protein, partial [Gemmataceae bacterium]|nr:BBP7 family outer membrane beta-barrel protein [Gemmataceae bacterium]